MNGEATVQLPAQWSTFAESTDWVYYFLYWMSVVLFVGIIGAALYFVWKYRRRPGVKAEPTGHNTPLEVGWTVAPLFLLVLLFHWGFQGYIKLMVAPADAIEIRVRSQRWNWSFEYPNGASERQTVPMDDGANANLQIPVLWVPVDRPVRLVLSSSDVLHSFYVPAFRIKHDAVPGMYSTVWFQATRTGLTDVFCAEYCGRDHSHMMARVRVVSQAEYDRHLVELNTAPPECRADPRGESACWGERIYSARGCTTCHGNNGEGVSAPRLRGIFGTPQPLADGTEVTADANYIRESILNPQARIVRGFQPVMPTFAGQLQDREIDALIAFVRSMH